MKNCRKMNQEMCRRFHTKGMRLTSPRKVILKVISEMEGHNTVEDIYMKVHKKDPSVGLTTIYRTLELLYDWGLVHKFDFGEGKSRYEIINSTENPNHHHHLICVKCKAIIDYKNFSEDELSLVHRVEEKLSATYNYTILTHAIEFHGICPDCKKNLY